MALTLVALILLVGAYESQRAFRRGNWLLGGINAAALLAAVLVLLVVRC